MHENTIVDVFDVFAVHTICNSPEYVEPNILKSFAGAHKWQNFVSILVDSLEIIVHLVSH